MAVTGRSTSSDQEILCLKVDPSGNVQWAWRYSNPFLTNPTSLGNSIKQTFDSGFIIAGNCRSMENIKSKALLLKIDSAGIFQWCKHYHSESENDAICAIQTPDKGYAFCGQTSENSMCIYFVKTDSSGNSGCYDSTFTILQNQLNLQVIATGGQWVVATFDSTLFPGDALYTPTITSFCFNNIIAETETTNNFSIFPNPTTGKLTIRNQALFQNDARVESIAVYSLIGEKVMEVGPPEQRTATAEIDIAHLPSGLYLVEINTQGTTCRSKIIKQ